MEKNWFCLLSPCKCWWAFLNSLRSSNHAHFKALQLNKHEDLCCHCCICQQSSNKTPYSTEACKCLQFLTVENWMVLQMCYFKYKIMQLFSLCFLKKSSCFSFSIWLGCTVDGATRINCQRQVLDCLKRKAKGITLCRSQNLTAKQCHSQTNQSFAEWLFLLQSALF